MIILSVMLKTLRQTFRNKGRLMLVLILPIIFFSFFGFAFGAPEADNVTLIGYVDEDIGYDVDFSDIIPDAFKVSDKQSTLGELFIDLVESHRQLLVNNSDELEFVKYSTVDELIGDVETQNIQLGLFIPSNFTESILSGYNDRYSSLFSQNITGYPLNTQTSLITYGDTTVQEYQSINSFYL